MSARVVIIPTYNERGNIAKIVPEVLAAAPDASVLVVDDNSPDGTAEVVLDLARHYPGRVDLLSRPKKEGLGRAYLAAFTEILKDSRIESVLTMDADFSHDPADVPKLFKLRDQTDLVVGTRYTKGGKVVGWEIWRHVLSRLASFYCRMILKIPISDYTGGFNCYSTRLLRQLDFAKISASGYAFQIEMKYRFFKHGAVIMELPIVFRNRREGESKISSHIIREGIVAPLLLRFGRK